MIKNNYCWLQFADLHAQLAALRADAERREAARQKLEYELTLSSKSSFAHQQQLQEREKAQQTLMRQLQGRCSMPHYNNACCALCLYMLGVLGVLCYVSYCWVCMLRVNVLYCENNAWYRAGHTHCIRKALVGGSCTHNTHAHTHTIHTHTCTRTYACRLHMHMHPPINPHAHPHRVHLHPPHVCHHAPHATCHTTRTTTITNKLRQCTCWFCFLPMSFLSSSSLMFCVRKVVSISSKLLTRSISSSAKLRLVYVRLLPLRYGNAQQGFCGCICCGGGAYVKSYCF